MLLKKNHWLNDEIRKHLKKNINESIILQNLCDVAKAVLREADSLSTELSGKPDKIFIVDNFGWFIILFFKFSTALKILDISC